MATKPVIRRSQTVRSTASRVRGGTLAPSIRAPAAATDAGKPGLGIELDRFIPWLATSMTRYLHGVMTEALAPLRISIAEWRVILCVVDGRSYTLTEVTDFTGLNQSSLSRAIVRIEK